MNDKTHYVEKDTPPAATERSENLCDGVRSRRLIPKQIAFALLALFVSANGERWRYRRASKHHRKRLNGWLAGMSLPIFRAFLPIVRRFSPVGDGLPFPIL